MHEQARGDGRVVRGVCAAHESLPAAVAEVEQSYDTHRRKAAARLLGEGLGVGALVGRSVDEPGAAAVDGFENMTMPEIGKTDAGSEAAEGPRMDDGEEPGPDAEAGPAVTAGVAGGQG